MAITQYKENSQSSVILYFSCNAPMRWWALALENYFTPMLTTHRANVVLCVLCIHRTVVFVIGSFTCRARALTILLNARTLDTFNLYMSLRILR